MNIRAAQYDAPAEDGQAILTPGEFVLGVWRATLAYRGTIVAFVAMFALLAVGYLLVTPKQYLASAQMIIDPRKSEEVVQQPSSGPTVDSPVDASVVESEGTVLTSENIALAVIKKLDLVNSPTFADPKGVLPLVMNLASPVLAKVIKSPPPSDYEKLRATVEDFENRLTVKRVGVTYVFDISFLSPNPQEAADVANAVAAAYVDDLLNAKYSSRLRASAWMQDRLDALSRQAVAAERAVADFKAAHAIVSTGGRSMDEQQVAELQSQLSLARAAKDNAKAKLDRIQQILATGELDLSVADALNNQVIISLRNDYLDMSKRASALEAQLGVDHEAPKRLRADMAHVRASIFDELKRIGEGYQSDYQIAESQEAGITADLAKAVAQSAKTDTAGAQLSQLESDAQAYRALYDTFLQRFGEVVQQQSFPLTETRLVTEASAPLKKSRPKTLLTLAGAVFAGALCGFGVGWLKDKTNGTLRRASEAEEATNSVLIANVPMLARQDQEKMARQAIDHPLSAFVESIREIRVFLELQRVENKAQVIGLTSAVSGEGKSTIAINLANLMAKSRAKVLLIDCDVRSPTLSRLLGGGEKGFVELLSGGATVEEALNYGGPGGFCFVPVDSAAMRNDLSEVLGSARMKKVIDDFRRNFDFIIIDLPPLLPLSDAKAASSAIDGFVLVAEWGKTPIEVLSEAVRTSGRVKDKMMGLVLNKVDFRRLGASRSSYVSSKYMISA